ncbi:TPA: hypothetical protein DEP34_05050 [Candidatus Uhrbacteria bacterium]|uniref:Uncharacterized protein n=2 Tax=Candidatus Uhriibacteriota TaxID=1752732 RepID=A0A0G1Q7C1_9BACT|nr:MAG: hypothetical protein UX45_C0013G0017 [Candidatus Uhrbacteria bacterium GW2011_GWF2_46_218]KKU40737.1 MAG: hypothetical protein UX57_C0011G0023 [Candidatus Uhrbacteria bacterium GW2011_GWE2_46_68]HBK33579.1 hypothetical protein [Candidatus Uhrbacteria bacterium]HCB19706.1 hypothetical protein [Candidatus Uhrbacteria bacterium]
MPSRQTPPLRNTVICGAVASLLNQGCAHDLTKAQGEKLAFAKELVQQGGEYIDPVLEEMAMVANEDLVFGVDGKGGVHAFCEDLHDASKNLEYIVLEEEQVYLFNDPNYSFAAFYRKSGRDLIAFNEACVSLVDENADKRKATYGIELHEAAHKEDEAHSAAVDAFVAQENFYNMSENDILQKLIVEERDFPYLLSTVSEELEFFLSGSVKEFVTRQYSTLDLMLQNVETQGEIGHSSFEEELVKMGTAEGWATLVVNENSTHLSFFLNYWGIPYEELQRIIAESGWYEEFVEEDVKEYVAEARRQLREQCEAREGMDQEIVSEPTFEISPHPKEHEGGRLRL